MIIMMVLIICCAKIVTGALWYKDNDGSSPRIFTIRLYSLKPIFFSENCC